jgi:aryl-alcohol dehydrogenase-like predicted oxidoreductase
MEYRTLGTSGLRVSALSYGNWITHGSQIHVDQAKACVDSALDAGITTFDTADVYAAGEAEAVLGEALAGRDRASYELCTKVFYPMGSGPNQRGLSRKHVLEACEASLRRLRTDHIDVYQPHQFDPEVALDETLGAFDHLVRQGKVLYVGAANWDVTWLTQASATAKERGAAAIVSDQVQYSLLWRGVEAELVPYCEQTGLSLIAWSPLAQGVLTGKYPPGKPPPPGSRADAAGAGPALMKKLWFHDNVLGAVQRLVTVAASAGLSLPQLALAWVLRNPSVATAIIGASRPEQIADNVGALGATLDEELLQEIEAVLGDIPEHTALQMV